MLFRVPSDSLINTTKGFVVLKVNEMYFVRFLPASASFQWVSHYLKHDRKVCISSSFPMVRQSYYPVNYSMRLFISGLGFRANVINRWLLLRLGYSHVVTYATNLLINIWVYKRYCIQISSARCSPVSLFAQQLIAFRKVDPYKGKGIRFLDKVQKLKPGKKE